MDMDTKNEQAEDLASQPATDIGDSLTETVLEISRRSSALPDLDTRDPDEILGYDEKGTFG